MDVDWGMRGEAKGQCNDKAVNLSSQYKEIDAALLTPDPVSSPFKESLS